jgi:hypothetical protein
MNCNNFVKYIIYFIILIILACILNNSKKMNIYNKYILIAVAVCIMFCVDKFCENYSIKKLENFDNLEDIPTSQLPDYAPINYSVGPYDDLVLKPGGCSSWRHPPACKKLYNPETLYTPQGTPLPLEPRYSIQGSNNGPPVDGTKNTPNDMFMFAYNQCRPECCPSTYSCDKGCVCTNKQQREFLNSRGNNRNSSIYYGTPDI